jgi:hypothetical protein
LLLSETISLFHFTTFLTVFPFGSIISYLSILLTYNSDRLHLLHNQQRPIPKPLSPTRSYRKVIAAMGHWMLFFNLSQMFITLEWLEYLFQNVVATVLQVPTPYTLMTMKYAVILILMGVYEIVMFGIGKAVYRTHSVMDIRKWHMFKRFGIKNMNT